MCQPDRETAAVWYLFVAGLVLLVLIVLGLGFWAGWAMRS